MEETRQKTNPGMIPETQVRWVAVNPEGSVCGPCMETQHETQYALLVGYARVRNSPLPPWSVVSRLGYDVVQVEVRVKE